MFFEILYYINIAGQMPTSPQHRYSGSWKSDKERIHEMA